MSTDASGMHVLARAALDRYPSDVADTVEVAPLDEVVELVSSGIEPAGHAWTRVLRRLSTERSLRLLEALPTASSARLLASLEAPLAASILSRFDESARSELVASLPPDVRGDVSQLLGYPAGTAGRIMDPRVLAFRGSLAVEDVLARIRSSPWKRVFEVFIVDDDGRLLGSAPLQEIAVAEPGTVLQVLMQPVRATVQSTATREEIVSILEDKRIPALATVDFDGRLLGVIRYDELIAAARAEASVDIQTMVGVSREERALSSVSFAVRKRLPWLQVNLGTAFLAASVVGVFEDMIARFTALAVLLPVVAGQSGNTGAQALAVTMRGLALREVRTGQWLRVILKEFRVGFVNGIAVAATTSLFVYFWSRSFGLAAVIGISMVLSMSIAGLSGGAIPMILTAIGQDPAQSSSIILTTITDVAGFFSFLGIATLLSSFL